MKGFQGIELNSHKTDDLVFAIGKFIVNFGAAEYLTYILIEELSHDEIVYDLSIDMPLSRRLKLIKDLSLKRKLDKELIDDIKKTINVAEDLAQFRNSIAHNPIMLSVKNNESSALIGIPNMKKAKNKNNVPVASLKKLNLGIDAVVELVNNLTSVLETIKVTNNA